MDMALIGSLLLIPIFSGHFIHTFLNYFDWRVLKEVLTLYIVRFVEVKLGRYLVIFKIITLEVSEGLREVLDILFVGFLGGLV